MYKIPRSILSLQNHSIYSSHTEILVRRPIAVQCSVLYVLRSMDKKHDFCPFTHDLTLLKHTYFPCVFLHLINYNGASHTASIRVSSIYIYIHSLLGIVRLKFRDRDLCILSGIHVGLHTFVESARLPKYPSQKSKTRARALDQGGHRTITFCEVRFIRKRRNGPKHRPNLNTAPCNHDASVSNTQQWNTLLPPAPLGHTDVRWRLRYSTGGITSALHSSKVKKNLNEPTPHLYCETFILTV